MTDPGLAGWPRPTAEYRDRMLPVPWINAPSVVRGGDWLTLRGVANDAHRDRLCAVCGEQLRDIIALGYGNQDRYTNGPGCHPRCLWMAVNTCPHLKISPRAEDELVGYLYEGPGVGYVCHSDDLAVDEPQTCWNGRTYRQLWNDHFAYKQENPVHPDAVELWARDLRELAAANPLGIRADRDGQSSSPGGVQPCCPATRSTLSRSS